MWRDVGRKKRKKKEGWEVNVEKWLRKNEGLLEGMIEHKKISRSYE